VLKKMLLHDGPRIEQDPWHVLAVPLYQKCRELNDQMGVEVLASLNPTRLSQVLTAKNPLEQGLKLIKKELEKLDKQVKQQQGMQERRENIARQVLFPPDLLDEIIPILTSVFKSPSSRYKRFDDGEISRLCLDVLERVAGLPTEELQAEKCEKWIAQLGQGHRTGELR
jgi:hypothetical protein